MITILNMSILKKSNTDHTSSLIDKSKPRTLIDDSKSRNDTYIIHHCCQQPTKKLQQVLSLRPINPIQLKENP